MKGNSKESKLKKKEWKKKPQEKDKKRKTNTEKKGDSKKTNREHKNNETSNKPKQTKKEETPEKTENKNDKRQVILRAKLHAIEADIPPIDAMFIYKTIEAIGNLADRAQSAGEQIQVIIAR